MVRHQMPPQEMISLKGSCSFLSVMTPVTTQAVILTFFGTQGSLVLAPGMGRVSKRSVTFVVQAQTCELTGNAVVSCVCVWEWLHCQEKPAYLRVAKAERRKR